MRFGETSTAASPDSNLPFPSEQNGFRTCTGEEEGRGPSRGTLDERLTIESDFMARDRSSSYDSLQLDIPERNVYHEDDSDSIMEVPRLVLSTAILYPPSHKLTRPVALRPFPPHVMADDSVAGFGVDPEFIRIQSRFENRRERFFDDVDPGLALA